MEESQCDGIGGHHKLKTRVINSNCNPVWNEQLTLSIKHLDDPIRLIKTDSREMTKWVMRK
ncbi:unnamed protein product [Brassica napus]|uniref:(rape) hypothetical protein n=1 Tax=Brassica napus TaxID=3708 RepID=A0A816K1R3_BRANA|nr:unnamed protein product [Brassica napus]